MTPVTSAASTAAPADSSSDTTSVLLPSATRSRALLAVSDSVTLVRSSRLRISRILPSAHAKRNYHSQHIARSQPNPSPTLDLEASSFCSSSQRRRTGGSCSLKCFRWPRDGSRALTDGEASRFSIASTWCHWAGWRPFAYLKSFMRGIGTLRSQHMQVHLKQKSNQASSTRQLFRFGDYQLRSWSCTSRLLPPVSGLPQVTTSPSSSWAAKALSVA